MVSEASIQCAGAHSSFSLRWNSRMLRVSVRSLKTEAPHVARLARTRRVWCWLALPRNPILQIYYGERFLSRSQSFQPPRTLHPPKSSCTRSTVGTCVGTAIQYSSDSCPSKSGRGRFKPSLGVDIDRAEGDRAIQLLKAQRRIMESDCLRRFAVLRLPIRDPRGATSDPATLANVAPGAPISLVPTRFRAFSVSPPVFASDLDSQTSGLVAVRC